MKKIILLPLSLVMLLSVITVACSKDDDSDVCKAFTAPTCPSLKFTTCSDGDQTYMSYKDKDGKEQREYCDKDDCTKASEKIINKAGAECSQAVSMRNYNKAFVLSTVKNIRAEAMAAAGCE